MPRRSPRSRPGRRGGPSVRSRDPPDRPGERSPGAKLGDDRFEQCEIGEVVACALNEQHGPGGTCEVLGALDPGALRWMQRKAQEHQTPNPRERRRRVCARRHAAAERLAAREPREPGQSRRCVPGGSHRGFGDLGTIRAPPARDHVWKLPPQRRDTVRGERLRGRGHERVAHAGAGTVREHVQRTRTTRSHQQAPIVTQIDLLDDFAHTARCGP
jgi:hypothetical protein